MAAKRSPKRPSRMPAILGGTGLLVIFVTAGIAAALGLRPTMGSDEDMSGGSLPATVVVFIGVALMTAGGALRWGRAGAPERQRMDRQLEREIGFGDDRDSSHRPGDSGSSPDAGERLPGTR